MKNRAGYYVEQPTGYKSFLPAKLPPNPSIQYDAEMLKLLSEADRKLGRLDGITEVLPNPELFVAMYVKKEALLSSQIEGTQASLIEIIDVVDEENVGLNIKEVINYVNAVDYGLSRLNDLPLCLRLIREIHAVLLETGRGSAKSPGEFRTGQNWIGPSGCSVHEAVFVPPSVSDMNQSMSDLEAYFYNEEDIPGLIKIALIHAQFETIHPFLDGNGRMGRLLITFWLCYQNILKKPLLYLSYYFKINRLEYYDRLMAIRRKGDWEGWIKFFLSGVSAVSDEATSSAAQIIHLKERCSQQFYKEMPNNSNYQKLLDELFISPIVSKSDVQKMLNISYPTAASIVDKLGKWDILKDISPSQKRYKRYSFYEYLLILEKGTELYEL